VPVEEGVIAVSPGWDDLGDFDLRAFPWATWEASSPCPGHANSADSEFDASVGCQAAKPVRVTGHHGNTPAGIDRRGHARLLTIDRDTTPTAVDPSRPCSCLAQTPRCPSPPVAAASPRIVAQSECFFGDVVGPAFRLRAHQIARLHLAGSALRSLRPYRASFEAQSTLRCARRRE